MKRLLINIVFCLAFLFNSNAELNYSIVDYSFSQLKDTISSSDNDSLIFKRPIEAILNRYLNRDTLSFVNKYGFVNPANIKSNIKYDFRTGKFIAEKKLANKYLIGEKKVMSLREFIDTGNEQSESSYWKEKSASEAGVTNFSENKPELYFGGKLFDALFGSNKITIRPQGSAELTLGVKTNRIDNPTIPENLRKTTTLDFNEKIQMNVSGSIGERLKLDINYNTEATFDYENQIKLNYEGKEDEIVKSIEAGNVSLPLSGTLINGGQNLFGFKTALQFGRLTVTSVFSQQKGESSMVRLENGAQKQEFEVSIDKYESNKHFFLSHYFRKNYNNALKNLPIVNSAVNIVKVEVWITNRTSRFEKARNIVAFTDLGEGAGDISNSNWSYKSGEGFYPGNGINTLYEEMVNNNSAVRDINQVTSVFGSIPGFVTTRDYEKVENARLLDPNEYSVNEKLGYISLNRSLNADEVLAVAYEYTVRGEVFRVGEFTSDGPVAPNTLFLKLLKGVNLSPSMPQWDLMMKNIYNIGAYRINPEDFVLNVLYRNDKAGTDVNYLPAGNVDGEILLKVLNLDNLNTQLDPHPDGLFDFIDGITIVSNKGIIVFPVTEPFGSYLRAKIGNNADADKFVFEELYSETQSNARQLAEKNKFILKGGYKSSTNSEIDLNAPDIARGAVKVVSGSRELVENIDYTVDYALGKVKIINQSILEAGTPIQISSESNSMFDIQTKTLIGTHLDYKISDEFNLGATILHMSERPLTQKVNIGDEPISNTIWGINGSYSSESEFLTRMVDKIPFINTKAKSRITVDAEFAQFLPGHNSGIGREGNAYIDDFEGSKISIDLKAVSQWKLSSTPQDNLFPEGKFIDDLQYGYNRAKIAWYIVDPLFYRKTSSMPSHIKADADQRSNHFIREIKQTEVYPNKDIPVGNVNIIAALNVAYYPDERGPYNFDVKPSNVSAGIDSEGKLKNPESRWGGIMRKIQTNDFEAANIQYIEFWMLDPFVYNENHSGGELFFDLGNISEDILRDSRKSFENGMPVVDGVAKIDTTKWGRVPLVQSLVNGFDNNIQSRRKQDVGLDGLNSEEERSFFIDYLERIKNAPDLGELSKAYSNAVEDPSGDDFHYFRGADYDANKLTVLARYKRYNNPEGNSPTADMSPESYPTSATSIPDNEDINQDNTLSETESFYRYKIMLKPNAMKVGENFISDMRIAKVDLPNGTSEDVRWYQFKIPITEYSSRFGDMEDFKSVRFVRMLLKGFRDSVVLRMASLDLVRDNWRRYEQSLNEYSEENGDTKFDISAVNIEENSEKTPVNYVLPPGIDRVLDASNPQLRQLNEQSLVLKVMQLHDGDARAIFKSVSMDMLRYKRLKMDVHAEKIENMTNLEDNDLHIFIRIGTDYKNNYYEYELPLKLTPPGYYPSIEQGQRAVWPLENQMNIPLEYFQKLKLKRNAEIRKSGSEISYATNYTLSVGELVKSFDVEGAQNLVRIVGNPTLGDIRTVMIGVRNPKQAESDVQDDGLPKSAEVWVNELRLSDFDEKGGWAANVRMTARMADFATVTLAGSKIAPGFGSIDQRVSQISRDDQFQYDFTTNVELGKFLPDEWNVKIPMYYAVSSQTIKPEYDPVNTDIPLKERLKNEPNAGKRDSISRMAEDYVHRRSINFTNVGVQDNDGNSSLIDISNLSLTYSYTENEGRNVNTVRNLEKNERGLINYTYNGRPKLIEPFKNSGILKSEYLRLLRDFNFYLLPSQLSIRSDISRRYHEIVGRNLDNPLIKIEPTYDKEFLWNRYYDLRFNLSKNLKFDFSATAVARIDETEGLVDKETDRDMYYRWRDTVWNSILDGGRTVQYHHNFSVTYNLPINKIPLLNWTNTNVRYAGNYDWQGGAITDEDIDLGNEIRNSNAIQVNTQLNLTSLYNKVNFLKKMSRKNSRYKKRSAVKQVKYEKVLGDLNKAEPMLVSHNLKTRDLKVRLISSKGKLVKVRAVPVSNNKVRIYVLEDVKGAKVIVRGRVVDEPNKFIGSLESITGILLSVKNISLSYSENSATTLPGYLPSAGYFGGDTYNGFSAPGFGFIAGFQDNDFVNKAAEKGWITKNTKLNSPYIMTTNTVFSGRAVIEPLSGFRINLTARRAKSNNNSEYINYNDAEDKFTLDNKSERGNFSMTYIGLKSSFFKIGGSGDYFSKAYDEFLKNRKHESLRLAKGYYGAEYENYAIKDKNGISTGYYKGYGSGSQEVLIPSFLSAYGMGNSKGLFPGLMSLRPNWNISFVGLRKLSIFKRLFKTLNINHAYSCTYNIGSFVSNLSYSEDSDGLNMNEDFLSKYEVNTVSITEQFSPLVNVDMVWRNNFTTNFEISRKRNLALSLSNSQLSENTSNEVVLGCGYRFNRIPLIVGKNRAFNNDLNIKCDFSIRKDNTIIRKINEYVDQLTAGQKVMTLKISGDYTLNNRFNLRVFYDKVVNTPYVSLAYPTTNANFGLSVRFTLAQ